MVPGAAAAVKVTTLLCLLTLWLVAAYVLLRTGGMLTLFTFASCLLCRGAET